MLVQVTRGSYYNAALESVGLQRLDSAFPTRSQVTLVLLADRTSRSKALEIA